MASGVFISCLKAFMCCLMCFVHVMSHEFIDVLVGFMNCLRNFIVLLTLFSDVRNIFLGFSSIVFDLQ